MSYDLQVRCASWPPDLDGRVVRALADVGVTASLDPRYPLRDHEGGWFPLGMALSDAARARLGAPAAWREPIDAGFELYVSPDRLSFSAKSAPGTGPAYLVALAIAHVSGGTLTDPQIGVTVSVDGLWAGLDAVLGRLPEGWTMGDVCSFPARVERFAGFD